MASPLWPVRERSVTAPRPSARPGVKAWKTLPARHCFGPAAEPQGAEPQGAGPLTAGPWRRGRHLPPSRSLAQGPERVPLQEMLPLRPLALPPN